VAISTHPLIYEKLVIIYFII